jgi:hypothetical protein
VDAEPRVCPRSRHKRQESSQDRRPSSEPDHPPHSSGDCVFTRRDQSVRSCPIARDSDAFFYGIEHACDDGIIDSGIVCGAEPDAKRSRDIDAEIRPLFASFFDAP